jgi:aspartate racemase
MSEREQNQQVASGVEKSDAGVGKHDEILGLIGGLGPGAAVHYYQELSRAHSAARVPLRMLMANADVDTVTAFVGRGEMGHLAEYLGERIRQLKAGGATFAAIPAVTPHICLPELAPRSALPLVDMLDLTRQEIERRGVRRVALFGTRYVIQSRMFGRLRGIDIVTPAPDEIERIHAIYFSLVESGHETDGARESLIAMAKTLRERDGAEAIVLAGTDLALVFPDEASTPFPSIDCARIHLDAILEKLMPTERASL